VASSALNHDAKERLDVSLSSSSSTASAAMSVAGFPGSAMVAAAAAGKHYFPLMGDQKCQLSRAALCPAAPDAAGADGFAERTAGMLRHSCDTGHGMSGAPLWLHAGTPEAQGAAAVASAGGFGGRLGRGAKALRDALTVAGADGASSSPAASGGQELPAVAVGVMSRHFGDCPWGADCVNMAAPLDAAALEQIRTWVGR